ncbi:MAG: ERCC4 domain-containing protein [Candidatus Pacearchaeota archaeon]
MKNKIIFENIFSRRERIINPKGKPEEKPKILADYREKNSLVPSELISLGLEVEFRELKVADFIVRNVAIERKTISDFISSMINKRLLRQLEELQQYDKKILIIEGIDEQELYSNDETGINGNAIRGFLLSILLKHNIPILFTKNYEDTAKFISLIAKKEEHEMSTRAVKKSRNKKEQMQYILEGFPGIGPKTSKKLFEQFKSIKNIINAPEEELKNILGKKAEIFKNLIEGNY